MKSEYDFILLFRHFIDESKSGKRLQSNGSKIRRGTISLYEIVRNDLIKFSESTGFKLRIMDTSRFKQRQLKSEINYWRKFYKEYSEFLFKAGCFDNYVGAQFKVIRTFLNYLKNTRHIQIGELQKILYVNKDCINIVVLNHEQLKFLIESKEFEEKLPDYLKRTKDIFVFGCTIGLRYSDLIRLTKKNLDVIGDSIYLRTRSTKTGADTSIKLPKYAITIIEKYKKYKTLIPVLSKSRLNLTLKELCEKAGWTYSMEKCRTKQGQIKKLLKNGRDYRFCDLVSTHTMRRTAITTLLSLGMPEIMVRKISGHAAGSVEFFKYVQYAQGQIDHETDKAFNTLIGQKTVP